MRFNMGDIIRIGKDSKFYVTGQPDNPRDMNGKILSIKHNDESIKVRWDNGTVNWYNQCDLKLRQPVGI